MPKIIPILGAKWSAVMDRWLNGKGKSFQAAHDNYLARHSGCGKMGKKFAKVDKRQEEK